jgi:hypothetical protein
VARDQIHGPCVRSHPDAQGAAAHLGDRRAVVINLHRAERARELADVLDILDRQARQEPDPDAAAVGEVREGQVPLAANHVGEVLQRLGLADLLNGDDVRRDVLDDIGERGQLGVVDVLAARPGLAARAEEVLEIPGRDDHRYRCARRPDPRARTHSGGCPVVMLDAAVTTIDARRLD